MTKSCVAKMSSIENQSMTWRTSISFVVMATLIVILIGYLSSVGLLPIRRTVEFEVGELQFIRVWLKLAIAIGVILPTIAFVIAFKHSQSRKILGYYLLLLGIQIATEHIFSQGYMSSLVVPIGTLYTAFRVWQLRRGIQLIQSAQEQRQKYKLLSGILWLVFYFWLSNLIVLLILAWPSILRT